MKLSESSRRPAAAILVTAALAAAGCGASTTTTGTSASSGTTTTPSGAGAPAGRPNGPGGPGTPVVGPAAEKVKAAALAKYPGTIQDIVQVPDGSYVAGVVRSSGGSEMHVLVSKSFTVTGVRSGSPRGGSGASPAGPPA
ncbi:MAG: hypothetical protein JWO02_789 [Solirubrobacterales bacterium]|nr:hypothetical protein [Solirubrobacterales bacterium]